PGLSAVSSTCSSKRIHQRVSVRPGHHEGGRADYCAQASGLSCFLLLEEPHYPLNALGADVTQLGADVSGTYAIRGREALQGNDDWLRLNQNRQGGAHARTAVHAEPQRRWRGRDRVGRPGSGQRVGVRQPVCGGPGAARGVIEMRNGNNTGWGQLRGYFLSPSSRTYKRDISPLDAVALDGLLGPLQR